MNGRAHTAPAIVPLGEDDPLPPVDRRIEPTPSVLDRLYRDHAPRLLKFFTRRTVAQDAGDLVNESFLRLVDARGEHAHGVDREAAYLQQIAKNVLRNRARAAFYRTTASLEPDDEVLHPSADLLALIETRDELSRVDAALRKLPAKTCDIFMAHRLDGATYAQIAERFGLSVKGVEWHMSKALAMAHRALAR